MVGFHGIVHGKVPCFTTLSIPKRPHGRILIPLWEVWFNGPPRTAEGSMGLGPATLQTLEFRVYTFPHISCLGKIRLKLVQINDRPQRIQQFIISLFEFIYKLGDLKNLRGLISWSSFPHQNSRKSAPSPPHACSRSKR